MFSKRCSLLSLVQSGSSGVELIRKDRRSPVGKYFSSVKINGTYQPGYDCCILCKKLLKRGKTCAIQQWKHKTRHLAAGAKYSEQELEELTRSFNKHSTQSRQEVVKEQVQRHPYNEPLLQLNFPNMQQSQDKVIQMPNEPLCPYVSPVIKFSHPTTIMIAGPTFSGKTTFVKRLLHEDMIEPAPERIIWIYKEKGDESEFARLKQEFPQVEFLSEIDIGRINSLDARENNLVILDDVMSEAGDSKEVAKIFTQGAHHRNMTVIFLVQNVFQQAKQMRTISLNTHFLVLYKNPRDQSQIRVLSNQMFPGKKNFLVDAYSDATNTPHSYLLIDLHPETPEQFRVRTNIFPGEDSTVYVPDDYKNPEDDAI